MISAALESTSAITSSMRVRTIRFFNRESAPGDSQTDSRSFPRSANSSRSGQVANQNHSPVGQCVLPECAPSRPPCSSVVPTHPRPGGSLDRQRRIVSTLDWQHNAPLRGRARSAALNLVSVLLLFAMSLHGRLHCCRLQDTPNLTPNFFVNRNAAEGNARRLAVVQPPTPTAIMQHVMVAARVVYH